MEYLMFSREYLQRLQTYYKEQMETVWTRRSDSNMTEFEDRVK
jgi:hypothetical protein